MKTGVKVLLIIVYVVGTAFTIDIIRSVTGVFVKGPTWGQAIYSVAFYMIGFGAARLISWLDIWQIR